MAFGARARWIFGAAALAAACTSAGVDTSASPPPAEDPAAVEANEPTPADEIPAPAADELPSPPPPVPDEPSEPPIGVRVSKRALVVYAQASEQAEFRGAIPPDEPFFVYALVDAPGCPNEGWARVSPSGFACLRHAEPTEQTPIALPRVPEGELVPFTYAKARAGADGSPAVRRWRTRHAFNAGKPHRDTLTADASYAFVRRHGNGRRPPLLIDAKDRVVPAEQMRRYKPSEFEGRDLDAQPLPEGHIVAWTRLRDTQIVAEPRPTAEPIAQPPYHAQLQARPAAEGWFEVLDAGDGIAGFIDARQVRAWTPPPPEPRIHADEVWIDVDLLEQTLTVMRGDRPVYATVVSTGKSGDATPTGLFRIYKKKALDDMQSAEGADEPYFVEAVPWTQYFHREFALHTAYWHDLFGNRTSHGCVNLSPRDGARLYALTRPHPIPGWNSVTETAASPGTSVRVRKGDAAVPDRRPAFSPASSATNE